MPNPSAFQGAPTAQAVSAVIASDGAMVPVESLAQTLAYDGSGNLSTVTVAWQGNTYVQTLTYTSSKLTGVTVWVKQ